MKKLHTYLFSSLTICHECGGVYRGIYENQKKYICSNYSNQKTCSRRVIKEDEILKMVEVYCQRKNITIELTPLFMINIIESIVIQDENNYDIYYKDNSHQFVHDNGIKFL